MIEELRNSGLDGERWCLLYMTLSIFFCSKCSGSR